MFTSLEVTSLASGKQHSRPWSIGWKLINRRSINQLICRLPLLAIWTLIVIFILYKSLSDINVKNNEEPDKVNQKPLAFYQHQRGLPPDNNHLLIENQNQQQDEQRYSDDRIVHGTFPVDDNDIQSPNVITKVPHQLPLLSIDSSTKKFSEVYARVSKVFILIVQNEKFHPLSQRKFYKNSYNQQHASKASNYPPSLVQQSVSPNFISIPPHIRLLIDILKSHKIEYTVGTTRTGLPTTLLVDQNDSEGSMKQYSVIVIDDFVKYTKLSRWVRDQLDRHCRKNQIGVITYLSSYEQVYNHRSSPVSDYHSTMSESRTLVSSVATEESLADQFPLTLKPVDKKLCQNLSAPLSCLIDYQLNELSPILRVLKRKQNFILRGPLEQNLEKLPWISMSSNHVTYEPLTWAKLPLKSHDSIPIELRKRNMISRPTSGSLDALEKDQSSLDNNLTLSYQIITHDNKFEARPSRTQSRTTYDKTISGVPPEYTSYIVPENGDSTSSLSNDNVDISERYILAMYDKGLYDGIRRVIFGGANHHWLNRILLIESIEHLSSGTIITPLERYIQIDIDDIFVGERGKRMNGSDVEALIETQSWLAKRINGGFKFNLGFSGKFFKHGLPAEAVGDEQLVAKAEEFTWFCHTWSHSKAHLSNGTASITEELVKNLNFAKEHELPLIGHGSKFETDFEQGHMAPTYAVAPHHSGVYPIHEPLYQAWRDVLNVQVTSTEEYPSLRPASGRRAFVHNAIQVLPRQTCGLYTHTIYRSKYPGGFSKQERNIRGGELFETILHNPVNIYMTHMSNYANDRLAPYTFMELVEFVQTYTDLELNYAASRPGELSGPAKLADYYFNLYPNERQPLWTNPCNDKRHLAIWTLEKHQYCSIVPKLLIVGPQKTGTTALYSFLKMNPLFKSSSISASLDFEEVQFFNDKHYFQGVDWYLSRFINLSNPLQVTERESEMETETTIGDYLSHETNPLERSSSDENVGANSATPEQESSIYFDKSATYFDDPKVPERASHLLPGARIVILLVNPADRAYSWYQHIKAHGDKTANSMSFEQVITAKDGGGEPIAGSISAGGANKALIALRNRCLHPGYYSQHLIRWLEFYPSRQIIIIDGQWFRHNPASVMNRLQLLLRLVEPLDYSKLLVYNHNKGFYCARGATGSGAPDSGRCLGSSKGRKYPPMSEEARLILNRHYLAHNKQLARILSEIGQPLPTWLDESLSLGRLNSALYWNNNNNNNNNNN